MINKDDIISFFNNQAEIWDEYSIIDETIINDILNNAGVFNGKTILDIGCGTGVLIPFYKSRNVKSVIAIDIANKMIDKAKTKFNDKNIEFICTDAQSFNSNDKYNCIVIFNAFPHFNDQKKLLENMNSLLKEDGYLTIAHSLSEIELNKIHYGKESISMPLLNYEQLINICPSTLKVEKYISNDRMYQIVLKKNNKK